MCPSVICFGYRQSTGEFIHPNGTVICEGYSGHGVGVNNPVFQNVHDVGPIPVGVWSVGQVETHSSHGPLTMPLTPEGDTDTFGRTGFLIHGDLVNEPGQRLASKGCIILPHNVRQIIADLRQTHGVNIAVST